MSSYFSTEGFALAVVQEAVEQYVERHGGFGGVAWAASHIDPSTFEARGFAYGHSDGAVIEVGRIARGIEAERAQREERVERLRLAAEAGQISEEEYLTEAYCFI